jgi:hypothetical protein
MALGCSIVAITVVPKVALIAILTVFDCDPLQLDQCDQQQDEEYYQTQWQ